MSARVPAPGPADPDEELWSFTQARTRSAHATGRGRPMLVPVAQMSAADTIHA